MSWMKRLSAWKAGLTTCVACVLAGQAAAHNHITVDTMPGTPPLFQAQSVIRAGYLPTEGMFSIASGRLMRLGAIAVYDVPDRLGQAGPLTGWAVGDELLLTSDYYFGTGRLDGGDFRFEMVSVTPVSGGPAVLAWGDFDEFGTFDPLAMSSGATRLERSFQVGIGGHDHDQGYAFGGGGWVQDVTVVAWDSNGVYADSAPVTFRLDNGDCPADFSRTAGVTIDDLFLYFNAWFTNDPRADFDHVAGVAIDDLFFFINAWFTGC